MKVIRYENGFLEYTGKGSDASKAMTEEIEIRRIFVPENDRKKKIGTELINRVEAIARDRGYKKIVTFSGTDPEREVFGKFLVANNFIRKGIGYKWERDI